MEDDEEESDEILNQVLDEIGVDLNEQLVNAPQGFKAQQKESEGRVAQALGGGADDDLQARLDSLKR